MKYIATFILFSLIFISSYAQYDSELVSVTSVNYGNDKITTIAISREGNRIKAKYFAARDQSNGKTVYQRFTEWSKNKQLVLVTSGTYMYPSCDGSDPKTTPVGLCIDNGITVNRSLEYGKFDGLAIVYPSGGGGGIALSNLKNGDLTIQESNGPPAVINLRDGYTVTGRFIPWAENNKATVFQSHLFVWKNTLIIDPAYVDKKTAKRRVLAVGTNQTGKTFHYVVDCPNQNQTIYDAASKAYNYLQRKAYANIMFMINLDTGCQDAFQVYKSDGSIDSQFKGTTPLSNAANLLCYYYE
jgi:hypothetical protein